MSEPVTVILARAYHFAAERHIAQKRKGDAEEPYMNHLTEVAELAARATHGATPEIVIAAVLHDTVEDTKTTLDEIKSLFGEAVAGLVAEVTDDKALPKQTRKDLQVAHAAHASPGAKVIKLADKTSNLRSLASSPPAGWDAARKLDYVEWATRVVDACRDANPWLAAEFDAAAKAARGVAAN